MKKDEICILQTEQVELNNEEECNRHGLYRILRSQKSKRKLGWRSVLILPVVAGARIIVRVLINFS